MVLKLGWVMDRRDLFMSDDTRCYLIHVDIGGIFLFVRELQVVDGYVVQCEFRLIVSEPKP